MNKILKNIYFILPFKLVLFRILKTFYNPSIKVAGYLKFKGKFNVNLGLEGNLKIQNDNSTLPTLFFWKGLNGYEPKSFEIWITLSKKSNTIFDVGANMGIYGLISQTCHPSSKVYFFEPLQRNVLRIAKNCEINKFNCKIEQVAVSESNGEVTFFDMKSSENTIGSIQKSNIENQKHHTEIFEIKVPTISLDDYILKNKIQSVDLVKIDVEGSEIEVLSGFKNSILKFKPNILIEINETNSKSLFSEFLSNLDFTYHLYEVNEKIGLIKIEKVHYNRSGNYLLSTNAELNK